MSILRPAWTCLVFAVSALAPDAVGQVTHRGSVDDLGDQGNAGSSFPVISGDGRYVAFLSTAANLVPGDVNGHQDVFLHDHLLRVTTLMSRAYSGGPANGPSYGSEISADGRFVVFGSTASNLVPNDTNGCGDVFVHDRLTSSIRRVSVDSNGQECNLEARYAATSRDGRIVAFSSHASNLVAGDTNGDDDVFCHDTLTGQTIRVSVDSTGLEVSGDSRFADLSADGRFVAYRSYARNLVPGDTNGTEDVFVHDRVTGLVERVSVSSSGGQANRPSNHPAISGDGRFVAFACSSIYLDPSDVDNRGDILVHDRLLGTTTLVSVDSSGAQILEHCGTYGLDISEDGQAVVFTSDADSIVSNDANGFEDCFVRHLPSGTTELVSQSSDGVIGNLPSDWPSISADGASIAFSSLANNLVAGDTAGQMDAFAYHRNVSGPHLTKVGSCPGPVTLIVREATPGRLVAILRGGSGAFSKPTQPCQGLTLDLGAPGVAALRRADASGSVMLSFTATPATCGATVQAVDVVSCLKTAAIQL